MSIILRRKRRALAAAKAAAAELEAQRVSGVPAADVSVEAPVVESLPESTEGQIIKETPRPEGLYARLTARTEEAEKK